MDFIIGLLNNIFDMVRSILKMAGIDIGYDGDLIPTDPKAE